VTIGGDGSSGTSGGAASPTATTPTPSQPAADSSTGSGANSASSDADTTGDDPTSGTTAGVGDSTGTTTGEPPHETDWGLCQITVDCDLDIVDEPKRHCNLTLTEGDGYVVYDGDAGLETRGRSSQGWPKHQYAVELWDTPNIELVAPGSSWRYNDGPTLPAADWMDAGYDDSGWAQGDAPLGYGTSGADWTTSGQISHETTIGFGPDSGNKYITSWYRHDFEVDDAAALDPVHLNIRADDGMVVYINGVEAARFNLPDGPIDSTTVASDSQSSLEEVEFLSYPIDNALLVDGTNVVATEVHQRAPNSSDVVMDLSLSTKPSQAPTNFFEFGAESDWILNGMYFDLSLYRNKLIFDLFGAFDPSDNYGPQGHYCEVTLNGDYHGIFNLGEKIKRDDDRVDIAHEMGTGSSFIFKSDITKTWVITNNVRWQLVYPNEHDVTAGSEAGLNAFMTGFGDATAGFGNVWDYVDMDSAVDWVLLQEFTRNGDAYSSSMHIYKDVGGRIRFVPWDFDIGMGGSCNNTENWIGRSGNHWLNALTEDPAFQTAFQERWEELRDDIMSLEAIEARLDGYQATMTPEQIAANFDRWPMDEIIGGDDWVLPFRNNCPVDTWEEEDALIREWIANRLDWMDQNIQTFN